EEARYTSIKELMSSGDVYVIFIAQDSFGGGINLKENIGCLKIKKMRMIFSNGIYYLQEYFLIPRSVKHVFGSWLITSRNNLDEENLIKVFGDICYMHIQFHNILSH
ncbi:hypothetical protein ACJX0J_009187, partial [Zea mays]